MADSNAKRSWSVEGVDPDAAAIAKAAADDAGMTISEWLSQAILKNTDYQSPDQKPGSKPKRPGPVAVDASDDFAESETIVRPTRRSATAPPKAGKGPAAAPPPAAPPHDEDDVLEGVAAADVTPEPEPDVVAAESEILAPDAPDPEFAEPGEGDGLPPSDGAETPESREIQEAMEEIRRTIVFASAVPVPGEDAGEGDAGSETDDGVSARRPDAGAPEAEEDDDPTLTNRNGEAIATAEPEEVDRGPQLPFGDGHDENAGAEPAPSSSNGADDAPGVEISRDARVTPEDGLIVAAAEGAEGELPLDFNPHAPGADYRLAPDDLAALRTIVAAGDHAEPEKRRRRPWILLLLLLIAGGIAAGSYFYPEQARTLRERITGAVSDIWSTIRSGGEKPKAGAAGSSSSNTLPPPSGTSGTPSGSSETSNNPNARMPEGPPPMPPGQNPGWYKQAAEAGDANAQYVLAGMFLRGNGIPKDTERGASWLMKAADRGHPQAQFALGELYERGEGVAANIPQAVKWYEMAARQQHGMAQLRLGELYLVGGADISRDFGKAHLWLIRAAKAGVPDAQYALGVMYRDGLGVPADNPVAFKWFTYAAQAGHNRAEEAVRDLDGRLTGSERAEARNLLKEPRPTPKPPMIAGSVVQPGGSGASSGGSGNSGASIIVEPGPTPRGKTIIIRGSGTAGETAGETGGATGGTGTAASGTSASGSSSGSSGSGGSSGAAAEAKKTPEVKEPPKAKTPPETASKPPPKKLPETKPEPKAAPKPVAKPEPKPAAKPDPQLAHIQKLLAQLHLDPGNTRGVSSAKTREAIRLYQKTAGLPVDGKPSLALLKHLQAALGTVNSAN